MPDHQDSEREHASVIAQGCRRIQAVANGRGDIAAGRFLIPRDIDERIEALGTAYERPVPQSTSILR
jgi:hypothetical protein